MGLKNKIITAETVTHTNPTDPFLATSTMSASSFLGLLMFSEKQPTSPGSSFAALTSAAQFDLSFLTTLYKIGKHF